MSKSNKRRQERYDPASDTSTIAHKKYEGTFGTPAWPIGSGQTAIDSPDAGKGARACPLTHKNSWSLAKQEANRRCYVPILT
jgi:hypothetical protein